MRCRKVRSYLSAYSNDEVVGRDLVAVREHLSTCSSCRREEALYSSMRQSARELKSTKLPADFNAKLLSRIAQERFSETRSKAYFPRVQPPLFQWRHLAPALSAAVVLALVGTMILNKSHQTVTSPAFASSSTMSSSLDDSYLTAQPNMNPNMTAPLKKDWSLDRQLAMAERSNQLSGRLTSAGSFASADYREMLPQMFGFSISQLQSGAIIIRVIPVFRVYDAGTNSTTQEDQKVY
jgi:hypothetical protein